MKRFVITVLLLPLVAFGQSFLFHSDTVNFHGQPGDFFDKFVDIQNVSNDSLNVWLIRTQNDLPNGMWSSSVCTAQLCFPPEVDTVDYTIYFGALPPGSVIDFHLQVFTDPIEPGTATVTIKVENQTNPGDTASQTFTFSTQPTNIQPASIPVTGTYQLLPNYPNPFNPETTIPFEIGGFQSVPAKLTIYNIIGQQVVVPLNQILSPGIYEVIWDGRDNSGKPVSSGLYFYELSAGNFRMLDKMILLK